MTTTELKRIEALLKQWQFSADMHVDDSSSSSIRQCATEMGELLQSFSDGQTMDDIWGKLSKFLDWQQGKMDSENYAMEYFEERRQESLKELEAKSKNPPT